MMGHAKTKLERITQILHLLENSNAGLTAQEIATFLGVHRSTIHRNLQEMSLTYPLYADNGKYLLDTSKHLRTVSFSPTEALIVYLALRRYLRQTSQAPIHIVTSLQKISERLRQPSWSQGIIDSQDELLDSGSVNPRQSKIWEALVEGWLKQRVIHIRYRKPKQRRADEHRIEPLLFEPSILSHGTYVVCWSRTRNGIRTFKIDRIVAARLTVQTFEKHGEIKANELLQHAWGIWFGTETTRVLLRFNSEVAERVQETKRHPSEVIEEMSDGSLMWSVEIAGYQELIPWIRGWGSAVEVLAPAALRKYIREDFRKAVALYE